MFALILLIAFVAAWGITGSFWGSLAIFALPAAACLVFGRRSPVHGIGQRVNTPFPDDDSHDSLSYLPSTDLDLGHEYDLRNINNRAGEE